MQINKQWSSLEPQHVGLVIHFYRGEFVCRSSILGQCPLQTFNILLGNLTLTFQNKDSIQREVNINTEEVNRQGGQVHSWGSQAPSFISTLRSSFMLISSTPLTPSNFHLSEGIISSSILLEMFSLYIQIPNNKMAQLSN